MSVASGGAVSVFRLSPPNLIFYVTDIGQVGGSPPIAAAVVAAAGKTAGRVVHGLGEDGCQVAYTRGAQCDELGEGSGVTVPPGWSFLPFPIFHSPHSYVPLTSSAAGRCRGDGAVVQGVKVSRCSIM